MINNNNKKLKNTPIFPKLQKLPELQLKSFQFEKYRKSVFYLSLFLITGMLFAYNLLTPYSSDDLIYKMDVLRANSLWDLLVQQYQEYLNNNGRFIGQFNIRLSLLGSKMIFNIINSIMFTLLALLIYSNIRGKKKHDVYLLLLITAMLWRYGVEFGQTILWLCGACNYLWGSVIILGFVTCCRRLLSLPKPAHPIPAALLCLAFGLAAGWCNENTSGGGFLLLFFFTALTCRKRKKAGLKPILPYMVTAHIGMAAGIILMICAPGIANRAAAMSADENFTGLIGYLSRFYKCCLTVRELFFELICFFIIVTVIAAVCNKYRLKIMTTSLPFFAASAATAFALIASPPPMDRAYFGAGIFLIIACLQSFVHAFYAPETQAAQAEQAEYEGSSRPPARQIVPRELYTAAKYALLAILSLWLFFTYIENLVNLGRIYREENERIALIREAAADEAPIVVVPQYRPEFETRYSNAHATDMTDDSKYWINHFYENYYGIAEIKAIPRTEWDALYSKD